MFFLNRTSFSYHCHRSLVVGEVLVSSIDIDCSRAIVRKVQRFRLGPNMACEIRHQYVKRLTPGSKGDVHAVLRCSRSSCGHKKYFYEIISDDHQKALKNKSVCSRCGCKDSTLDLFLVQASQARFVARQEHRMCKVCGAEIAEHTLEHAPHTVCCAEHLDHNPPAKPVIVEPMGSREDFKKDSASNWSLSTKPKF